jgi:exodeoxyribonuclease-3
MPVIATWNVNSINARLEIALAWLRSAAPDIVLLQEIKCTDDAFPRLAFVELGYEALVHGQKGYNGVAILTKAPARELRRGLPGEPEDAQARYLEAETMGLRVGSIYLPNGNPTGTEKFAYKLRWLERLRAHAEGLLLDEDEPVVLGGDYNVIPEPRDVHNPEAWEGDALYRPESRRAFRGLLNLGLVDAVRALHPEDKIYSFWDYQKGAFQLDHGIRIDHLLLSARAADRLEAAWVDKDPRARPKASDHTPVLVRLKESS